jgi:hypothetical protein
MVFACYARSGPVPLPPGVCGWVVTEPFLVSFMRF